MNGEKEKKTIVKKTGERESDIGWGNHVLLCERKNKPK